MPRTTLITALLLARAAAFLPRTNSPFAGRLRAATMATQDELKRDVGRGARRPPWVKRDNELQLFGRS